MATPDQVTQVRRLAAYDATDPYDDSQLSALIDSMGLYMLVSMLWGEKAAGYVSMVNISESGSSRNMGDLHKNALAMSQYYKKLADDEAAAQAPEDLSKFARTRAIVREA
jgi:hypothetical protein